MALNRCHLIFSCFGKYETIAFASTALCSHRRTIATICTIDLSLYLLSRVLNNIYFIFIHFFS